jgi:phosphoheptose isomerase
MKVEAVSQQDAVIIETHENVVELKQVQSHCGHEDVIAIHGKGNLDALIGALQKAREALA